MNANGTLNIRVAITGMQQAMQQLRGFSSAVARFAGPLAGVASIAGLTALVKNAADAGEEMGKLAQIAGTDVRTFSALAASAKLADLSTQDLRMGLRALAVWMVKNNQAGRDMTAVLLDQAGMFSRTADGAQKLALARERFGKSGELFIPWLNKGAEAIRAEAEEARALGAVITPEFAALSNEFNDNLKRMQMLLLGIGIALATQLLPYLNEVIDAFIKWNAEAGASIGFVGTLVDMFKTLAGAAILVAGSFEAIGAWIGAGWGNLSATLNPFDAVKASVDAASASLDKMWGRFQRVQEIGKETTASAPTPPASSAEGQLATVTLLQQRQMELANLQARISAVGTYGDLTKIERGRMLAGIYAEQLEVLKQQRTELAATASAQSVIGDDGKIRFTQEYAQAQAALNKNLLETKQTEEQLRQLRAQDSWGAAFAEQFRQMRDSFGTFQTFVASGFVDSLRGAFTGLSRGIADAIMGAKSMKQAFADAARSMVAQLLQVAIQALMIKLILSPLGIGFPGFSGGGYVKGLEVGTGYASGGFTGMGGKYEPAGIVHRGEFVMPATAVSRIGLPTLEALRTGDMSPTISPAPVSVVVVNSADELKRFLESKAGEQIVVQHVSRRKADMGLPT